MEYNDGAVSDTEHDALDKPSGEIAIVMASIMLCYLQVLICVYKQDSAHLISLDTTAGRGGKTQRGSSSSAPHCTLITLGIRQGQVDGESQVTQISTFYWNPSLQYIFVLLSL